MTIDNVKLFFQPGYLLNPYPSYEMKFLVPLLIFFGALIVLSLAIWLFSKKKRKNKPLLKLLGSLANWLVWIGAIGLLLLFFRYEGIPYVSTRVALFLWLVVFVIWGASILFFGLNQYRKTVKEFKEEEKKKKYFRKR